MKRLLSFAIVLSARPALAHVGHGEEAWSGTALHYLLEPEHLPLTAAGALLVFLALRGVARAATRRAGTSRLS